MIIERRINSMAKSNNIAGERMDNGLLVRNLEDIRTDFLALEYETEGLLEEIIKAKEMSR